MPELNDTGRIKSLLDDEIRASVFGSINQNTIDNELKYYTLIDFSHISMLAKQSIIETDKAELLLNSIATFHQQNFKEIVGKNADRGTYLAYENYLIDKLGADIGGLLQTGRSRNDLNATVFKLRLRDRYIETMELGFLMAETLLEKSNEFQTSLFPAFTHYQTAFPSTFGHYLTALLNQLLRDLRAFDEALFDIETCPLGACAGGGTSIPIDPSYTSKLLGFLSHTNNSIDAVASRDLCIRGLSSLAHLSTTISRCSSDLVFWSANELGLVILPDDLVGSSSNMPQKRNPFLLEMIKGRSASICGSWVSAIGSMQWTPYSNSVSVSGESTKNLWQAFADMDFILTLAQKMLSKITINEERALSIMETGMVDAVFYAETIALNQDMSFRDAHHYIGNKVNEAITNNEPLRKGMSEPLIDAKTWFSSINEKMKYGGGTGQEFITSNELHQLKHTFDNRKKRWLSATQSIHTTLDSVK